MQNNFKMEDELMHYGILGMRWGVRRSRSGSSGSSRRKRKQITLSEDAKTAKMLKKKKLDEMSNAELRKLNERQNLGRQYRQMNKSHVAKGVAFVASAAAITNTAVNLYNNSSKLVNIGKTAGNKMIDVAGNMLMKDLAKGLSKGL